MLNKALILIAALFFLASLGQAQDGSFDVSLNGGAAFSKNSEGDGLVHSATTPVNVLATFRIRFNAKNSVALNYARAKNSQKYDASPFDFRVLSTVNEFTAAYVFSPFQGKKVEPFVLGGAGVLVFSPTLSFVNGVETQIGAVRQTRVAYLYGVGADYHFYWRLALRLQYRGLFYPAPDFKVSSLFTGAKGHLAEPSVGIVFRF
jgi:opacity protein-like surface antigen